MRGQFPVRLGQMVDLLKRGLVPRLSALLAAVPVLVLEGPRASGKTAVGSILGEMGLVRTLADLSDPPVRAAAEASPTSFVENLRTPAFIDEAQLVPELTVAVKRTVDRTGEVGAFILTGSSRLGRAALGGSDPLAGRASRARLWPMTQGELVGRPINVLPSLLGAGRLSGSLPAVAVMDLLARIKRGGLPPLAGLRNTMLDAIRPQLIAEYVEGVLYHEVGRRHDRAELERTYRYLAATTACLLNVSSIANALGAKRETIQSRLATLDALFLLHTLAGHRSGKHRAVTAHPKVHAVDTALASWAARVGDEPPAAIWGSLVETFVINELCAQAGWLADPITVRHWRDNTRKLEVDAVLFSETGQSVAIEVKAGADIRPDDMRGLRAFLEAEAHATRGVVFYTGGLVLQLDERIWAVPISALWTGLSTETR